MNKKTAKKLTMALYDWRKAYKARETDEAVIKARQSLARAEKRLQRAESPYREKMQGCQAIIDEIVPKIGKSVIAFGIRAKFTKGYVRATYDRSVLDRIAEENARFRNLIMPHRKETQINPRVNIEVAEPDTLLREIEYSPAALEIK